MTSEVDATIVAQVPVAADFMGPMVSTSGIELMTFGSDIYDGLVSVDWRTGKQEVVLGGFGTVYTFSAGFNRKSIVAVNIYPSPVRLFVVDVLEDGKTVVRTDATFGETVHAVAVSQP